MHAKSRRLARCLVVGATLVGFAGTAPAFAEGSWSSYIDNWTSGRESRTWTDRNSDSVSTTVTFSGCSTDSNRFTSTQLSLYKDVFGPDDHQGSRINECNTYSWGDKSSGAYYFQLDGFTFGNYLDVKSVVTRY